MTENPTVLNFIEKMTDLPPQVVTVERTMESKYQFLLLVRAIKRRLRAVPTYLTYEKSNNFANRTKAMLEEFSIFNAKTRQLYVLEGFYNSWVKSLVLPKDVYVVAETDGGELKTEYFTRSWTKKRGILKTLLLLIEPWHCKAPTPETEEFDTNKESDRRRITWEKREIHLSKLLKLDWSGLDSFEEFESIILKAKFMKWREKRIERELENFRRANLLTLIKRSDLDPIIDLIDRRGEESVYKLLRKDVADLIRYRGLRQMGFDEKRTQEEMDLTKWKADELAETAKMLTFDDLIQMAQRIVDLDKQATQLGWAGLQILLLNSPIRLKK